MPEYTLEELKGYVYALKEGRERSIGISWVKRKENKIMDTISSEMLKPPSTIQSWLARGQRRGLHGLADEKSAGRPPMIDNPLARKMREWLSRPPKDFGFKSVRWHLGMVQEKLHEGGIIAFHGTVRGVHAPPSASCSASRGLLPASPPQRRSKGNSRKRRAGACGTWPCWATS